VAVAGPLVTAPGGYPSRSWGAAGFTAEVRDAAQARATVAGLAESEVDLIKLALEPAQGQPVPDLDTARALVEAAHSFALPVTCHALTAAMVERALDAGVDELCHTPVEPLPPCLVERIAATRTPVVSTLHTLLAAGAGDGPMRNAKTLLRAGVRLMYGTDLGNADTRPGADPRELERLVDAGLTRSQALRAATVEAASVNGLYGRLPSGLRTGGPATCVVLDADPLEDFEALRRPRAVIIEGRVVLDRDGAGPGPR
jgi:imidazolonepropionase-like amidohydrolase